MSVDERTDVEHKGTGEVTGLERSVGGALVDGKGGGELAIRYASLKRLFDARLQVPDESAGDMLALAAVATCGDPEACNGVLTTPLTKSLNAYP